ncbi:hypothetical protein [[Kitasatospora] papulosa]|uniref:hypothetical protein n=1 Tax=[Kitasatospora] papulosa TaxID=1464011 RepID=UPI0036321FCB
MSNDILAFLDCVFTEQERVLSPLVGVGTCPDWGHCQPECTHQFGINDAEAKLRRVAAERKLTEMHGDRGHACPVDDNEGALAKWRPYGARLDYDGMTLTVRFLAEEACPVIQLLAEGYGWTEEER